MGHQILRLMRVMSGTLPAERSPANKLRGTTEARSPAFGSFGVVEPRRGAAANPAAMGPGVIVGVRVTATDVSEPDEGDPPEDNPLDTIWPSPGVDPVSTAGGDEVTPVAIESAAVVA